MMKRLLILAAFVAFIAAQVVYAATLTPVHAPIVGAQAQPAGGNVVLDGGDNTFVSAAVSPAGCVFLSYIDRDDGNRLKVKQDAGDHLIDVPLGANVYTAFAPGFTTPGDKQADGMLLIHGGVLSLYYTSRDTPTGSFNLRRLDMPLPNCV